MMLNTQTTTQDVHLEKPSLKDFFSFLITKRGFFSLIAVAWGFMLGGTALITTTVAATALLGGNWWIASFLCCLLGSYAIYFASSGMSRIYRHSRRRSISVLSRLFAEATFYGFVAPFYMTYLFGYTLYLKRKLVYLINTSNKAILERRTLINQWHEDVIKMKRDNRKLSRTVPRGDPRMTSIDVGTDKLRQNIQAYYEKNEADLLECRKTARDLGIVLRESETSIAIPANATVIYLLSIKIKNLAILGSG